MGVMDKLKFHVWNNVGAIADVKQSRITSPQREMTDAQHNSHPIIRPVIDNSPPWS
jgi:hypothetical protein